MLEMDKKKRLASFLCVPATIFCMLASFAVAEPAAAPSTAWEEERTADGHIEKDAARTPVQPLTEENTYVERARQAVLKYLNVELDDSVEAVYDDDIRETSTRRVKFGPVDGTIYRVAFGEDGIHRVYGAHSGEEGFWPDGDAFVDVNTWAARWGEGWLREGEMPDNGLEMTGIAGTRMLEIEREASDYLEAYGIPHAPWEGRWESDVMLMDGGWQENTDILIVIRYPNGSGKDLGVAGSSIDVGYSLYSKQIMYLALVRDGNG